MRRVIARICDRSKWGALLCSLLLLCACQPIQPVVELSKNTNMATAGRLVVADTAAGGLFIYDIPSWQQVGQIDGVMMSDHAGFIALPDGRVLFTTSDSQELIVLDVSDTLEIVGRVTLPGGSVHLAVDPTFEHVFVSTMKNEESGEGKTTLTRIALVDLSMAEQAIISGEPGLLVTADAVYHRDGGEIGRLQLFGVEQFGNLTDETAEFVDIGAYGHGEALVNDTVFVATDEGVDSIDVNDGMVFDKVIPWAASGREGGRAYYLRVAPSGSHLWSYLRIVANPDEDASWQNWQDWQNDMYVVDVASGEALRQELGPGLVYRMSISDKYAFYSRLHPDGDQAVLVNADATAGTIGEVLATIDLPMSSNAPKAGIEPWDATGQRITAMTPDGAWAFVTSGSDGVVHVIDSAAGAIVGEIKTPSALDGGGYMVAVQIGGTLVDRVGR